MSSSGGPPTVEMLGSGVVSTGLPEFATSLTPGGDQVFFNRTPPDRSRLELFVSRLEEDAWGGGRRFGPLEGWRAIDPFVSHDGSTLYFSSDRGHAGSDAPSFDLWTIRRDGEGWGRPEPLPPPVNTDSTEIYTSMSDAGELVFTSNRSGADRVYLTRRTDDGGWTTPVALTFGRVAEAGNPALHPRGRLVVLSIAVATDPPDLFVSCRTPSGWGEPVRLPSPINSAFADFAPSFHGARLYFTSERPGIVPARTDGSRPPGDLYWTAASHAERICP